jgi:deoxyuridine 5'-triphosphate nucleotidohydrolase
MSRLRSAWPLESRLSKKGKAGFSVIASQLEGQGAMNESSLYRHDNAEVDVFAAKRPASEELARNNKVSRTVEPEEPLKSSADTRPAEVNQPKTKKKEAVAEPSDKRRIWLHDLIDAPRMRGAGCESPADIINAAEVKMTIGQWAQMNAAREDPDLATTAPKRKRRTKKIAHLAITSSRDWSPQRIHGLIKGARVSIIFDSGASCSFISDKLAHMLRIPVNSKTQIVAHGLGGRKTMIGQVPELELTIGGGTFTIEVQVCHGERFNMLLGNDFIMATNAYVIPDQRRLYYTIEGQQYSTEMFASKAEELSFEAQNEIKAIPSDPGEIISANDDDYDDDDDDDNDDDDGNVSQEECNVVILGEKVTLPPQCAYECKLPKTMTQQLRGTYIFEAKWSNLLPHHILAAGGYGPADKLRVRLCNVSNQTVHLPPGMSIGVIEACQNVDARSIHSMRDVLLATKASTREHACFTNAESGVLQELSEEDFAQTINQELPDHQRKLLLDKLMANRDVFARDTSEFGRTNLAEHAIELIDDTPIRLRPYRYAPKEQEFIREEVQRMLKQGVISPSQGPWAFPVVLITKKDGTIRFCVDYRKLNKVTKMDSYPLPRIDEIFDSLAGASWFSAIDLISGYWQLPMRDSDKEKTAFITKEGTFQFNTMPFGLSTAPASFQRLMDRVYNGMLWVSVFVYLDDTQVFSRTFEEHLDHLDAAFDRLRKAGLKAKLKKCEFGKRELTFLGFRTGKDGLRADPDKVNKITTCPAPKNVAEVRAFLGLASYYRRFVANFAKITEPIRRLLKKEEPFAWTAAQQEAFDQVKQMLTTPPILAYPNFEAPFTLAVDASYDGIGAVLSQTDNNGHEHPIHFASRSTTVHEQRLATVTELEATALVWALQKFRHYLLRAPVRIYTDHQALKYILENGNLNRKFARWALTVSEYPHIVEYRKGEHNGNADALSRPPFVPPAKQVMTVDQAKSTLKVVRRTDTAKLPTRGSELAAGLDLYADADILILPHQKAEIPTGISIGLPPGTYGRIAPRSGLAVRHAIDVHAGVVDPDYTGEVIGALQNHGDEPLQIKTGERFAQLIIEKCEFVDVQEVNELPTTTRGAAGFGSTGRAAL